MIAQTRKKIEHYLYNYQAIDQHIEDIKSDISDPEYNQSYYKWIKNKSSPLEDQVIRNIETNKRICKIKKWQSLISFILKWYQKYNITKYDFIKLRYFERYSYKDIEKKLNLSLKQQKDIQAEILQYIFLLSIKKDMLREVF